jgi:hypothetical protein
MSDIIPYIGRYTPGVGEASKGLRVVGRLGAIA